MNRAVGAGAVKGIAATQREVVKERGVGFFFFFLVFRWCGWVKSKETDGEREDKKDKPHTHSL